MDVISRKIRVYICIPALHVYHMLHNVSVSTIVNKLKITYIFTSITDSLRLIT